MNNLVAIVGRPNVGKSTLFNRLIGDRQAIIDDISGVTRDRIYGKSDWNGKTFSVVDTGGFVKNSDDIFEANIRQQVMIAIEEADVIVLMVDVTTGITDLDADIANMLRGLDKMVLLVVNKVDNYHRQLAANEFWSLGFDHTFFLSSINGSGTGELLDAVVSNLPEDMTVFEENIPKLAIVGQPNVGKSSLINTLLDEERNLVTDIAGTTRDSIHSRYHKYDKDLYLIDTAGIRKKNKVHENLEFYSVMRAIRAIEEADVCILMIDAEMGLEAQDMKIAQMSQKRAKGIVIVVNKWDLVEKETNTARDYEKKIKQKLKPFDDIPVIFTSTLEKQRIMKVLDTALEVYQNRTQRIKTSRLNEDLLPIIEKSPPPAYRGRFIKIKYITQLPMAYPAFAFYSNHPDHIREPYKNFLMNQLRKLYNFHGVPIRVFMRDK